MKIIRLFFLILGLIFNSLHATDFPDIKGWKPVSEVLSYNPDNLYEYINGAADQFIAYGFQELITRDLSSQGLQVTVDIYDMGTRLNAFGLFKTESPREQRILEIGTEAYISPPYQCLLLKDNYYVKVNVYEGEITNENGKPLLKALAKALLGEAGYPKELQLLPLAGKIPDSEGYARQAFLGLAELTNCVHASYKDGDKEFKYFVMITSGKETNESILEKLSEKWQHTDHKKFAILVKKVPYMGLTGVILTGNKIIGVTECVNETEVSKRLEPVISQ